jgi:hypothetical protein
MPRRMTVLIDEALNFLKPGNDALLARRPARFFLGLDLDTKFFEKDIIFIGKLRGLVNRALQSAWRRSWCAQHKASLGINVEI